MICPLWIYTALDWAGIRDPKLPPCAERCLGGRTTECNDIYLHCVCQSLEYITSVQQCVAYTCEPKDAHKSNIFIDRICDHWNGWVLVPTKDRIFTDLRNLDLRDLDYDGFLNKRQAGSAGRISYSLVQKSTGYSLSLAGTAEQTSASSSTEFSSTKATTTQEAFTSTATGSTHNPTSSEAIITHTTSSAASASTTSAALTTSAASSSGLSSATKIGLGLGIPLGVIVLALTIFGVYFFGQRQGQQQKATASAIEQLAQTAEGQIHEAGGEEFKAGELPTYANIAELPSSAPGVRW